MGGSDLGNIRHFMAHSKWTPRAMTPEVTLDTSLVRRIEATPPADGATINPSNIKPVEGSPVPSWRRLAGQAWEAEA